MKILGVIAVVIGFGFISWLVVKMIGQSEVASLDRVKKLIKKEDSPIQKRQKENQELAERTKEYARQTKARADAKAREVERRVREAEGYPMEDEPTDWPGEGEETYWDEEEWKEMTPPGFEPFIEEAESIKREVERKNRELERRQREAEGYPVEDWPAEEPGGPSDYP